MNIQQRARELAIKAAHQDPDLHGYTLDARLLKPWEPHTWVVNAIAEALQGEADAPAPEEVKDEPVRIGKMPQHIAAKIVDMIETRIEPLHRRLDRLCSMVSMLVKQREAHDAAHAAEGRPQQVQSLAADVRRYEDVLRDWVARVAALEEWREVQDNPRLPDAVPYVVHGKVERFASGLREFFNGEAPVEEIAREVVAARRGPPPGVPYVPQPAESLAAVSARLRGEPEHAAFSTDPTTAAIEHVRAERDELRTQVATQSATMEQYAARHRQMELRLETMAQDQRNTTKHRDSLQGAFDAANNELGHVWRLVSEADGHGSPYWSEPGIADLKPSEAVAAVLVHLRDDVIRKLDEQVTSLCHEKAHLQDKIEEHKELEIKRVQLIDTQSQRRCQAEAECNSLRIERDEAVNAAEVTQLKLENMVSACADQAIQIMEGACTDYSARVRDIEATLKRKDELLENTLQNLAVADADRVPLRMDLDEAKASLARMEPLVATVERWTHSRGKGVDLSYAGMAQYAASGADAGLLDAYAEYQAACTRAADPDPDKTDCQAGTCDCPTRPGTDDKVHTADPGSDVPDMPF